jgi:beta-phosphoglucomutase-like phosphatase (HAD superfamily)
MFKALLFDLDGTLADTNSVHRLAWVDILGPRGYDVTWDFYRENITGRVTTEVVEDLFPGFSPEEVREMAEAKEANFREQASAIEPFPGLVDLVEKSREKGISISLVTNAPKENVLAMLGFLGLEDTFEPVILADEVGAGKPDPAPYTAALEALSISQRRPSPLKTHSPASPPLSPPASLPSASPRPRSPRSSKGPGSS